MKRDEKTIQSLGMILGVALMIPLALIPWLDYWKAADIWFKIVTFVSTITTPLGVIVFYIFSDRVYSQIVEDRKSKIKIKDLKPIDIFYKYVPADMVYLVLSIAFLGISTLIIYYTKDWDFLANIFGDIQLFQICVIAPLALAFYTIWTVYCNSLSTKKGRQKYILITLLIVAIAIFISLNI